MLLANDCKGVTADDWAEIADRILKRKEGEQFLLAVSDEHSGGVTSCIEDVKSVLGGFGQQAGRILLNGDDFEYESIASLQKVVEDMKGENGKLTPEQMEQLPAIASDLLHAKVKEDIAVLEKLVEENPKRQVIKVIGNHENFETFRKGLDELAQRHNNFFWTPEVAIMSMPGGEKGTRDRLLATHGDLQMDDLWFVGEGGTDKERHCLTHEEMVDKAVGIVTRYWTPSAQKQEKFQGFVKWWRKPNATAKALYSELLYRAQEGDVARAINKADINMDALATAQIKLKKRQRKFREFLSELDEAGERVVAVPVLADSVPADSEKEPVVAATVTAIEGDEAVLDAGEASGIRVPLRGFAAGGQDPQLQVGDTVEVYLRSEREVYERALAKIEQRLEIVEARIEDLHRKAPAMFQHRLKSDKVTLEYLKPNGKPPKLFTSRALEGVTHVNYGHTHVSAEAVEIKGIGGKEITVSNNASLTGAIMTQPLDDKGEFRKAVKGEEPQTDLGNMGALLYRIKDGKITEITTMGRLIAENLHQVKQMVREAQKKHEREDVPDGPSAIRPEDIIRRRASGEQTGPGGPFDS